MPKLLTQEAFLLRSQKSHGDKYDYSKAEYKGLNKKVTIICRVHGLFEQKAEYHMNGSGCPKCALLDSSKRYALPRQDFISRSKMVHSNKYDYSKVNYVNGRTKVVITCPIHGDFEQIPADHLQGRGCKFCGGTEKSNTEDFIKKAIKVHKHLYDYTKVNYIDNRTKICIICKEHGDFYQTPNDHLTGYGCPKCSESVGESTIDSFLKRNNYIYSRQFKLKECKNKRSLPFDFAIFEDEEKTKLKCLIEYDGEQHFKLCPNFKMTEKDLLDIQHRDSIKTNYCLENVISLLRISYLDKQNIEKIVNSFLTSMDNNQ